jgi:Tol biopolymer transport system component
VIFVGYSEEDNREFNEDIYVMDDGTGVQRVTSGRPYEASPSFFPDVFSRVTFHGRSEQSELFVMGSDGANKTQITNTPREARAFSDPGLPRSHRPSKP